MAKQIIFFHGGGAKTDYDADEKLVASLRSGLGSGYQIRYPFLAKEEKPDFGRRDQIAHEISKSDDGVILVAHSLGASMLLASLSEKVIKTKIAGIFLLATPFWDGKEDWVKAFKLRPDFAGKLDKKIPLFFYHCHDDEEAPFAHLAVYNKELPWASFREIKAGGHQFGNDLTVVSEDIKALI